MDILYVYCGSGNEVLLTSSIMALKSLWRHKSFPRRGFPSVSPDCRCRLDDGNRARLKGNLMTSEITSLTRIPTRVLVHGTGERQRQIDLWLIDWVDITDQINTDCVSCYRSTQCHVTAPDWCELYDAGVTGVNERYGLDTVECPVNSNCFIVTYNVRLNPFSPWFASFHYCCF